MEQTGNREEGELSEEGELPEESGGDAAPTAEVSPRQQLGSQ